MYEQIMIRLLSKVNVEEALTRFALRSKHPLPLGEGWGEGTFERSLLSTAYDIASQEVQ